MRSPIVAGNWKMNKSIGEAVDLAADVKRRLAGFTAAEIVLCPPFTALKSVGDLLRYSNIRLGAQNMHWESAGAFTGEVSADMLRDLGCEFVILGHSERRTHFGESDEHVQRKTAAALDAGLCPIVCVGETLEQREAGATDEVLRLQVERGLQGLGERLAGIVLAYEPVWAIGTGRSATAEQAQDAQAYIRLLIRKMAGETVGDALRILYGGSVNPSNAKALFSLEDVDGGLVGGASLEAESFEGIANGLHR
jgi:triosephosphate isomerase